MINNNEVLLSLVACPSLGPKTIARLEQFFPNLNEVFRADYEKLIKTGLSAQIISKFINWRKNFSLTYLLEQLRQENIAYLSWHDPAYPNSFKEISAPPPIIFYQGDSTLLNRPHRLAIVGSRRPTPYAEKIIKEFLPPLINQQVIIISGLALGVDALAHQQTLNNSGLTIAVLGSGLKRTCLYPAINRRLAKTIINRGGLIITEFPPDMPAKPSNFPRRNRLISGLAEAVLVVEAAKKSGSLITANFALEQNREVLAIPGNIFLELTQGTNNLIQEGATVILTAADILGALRLFPGTSKQESISKKLNYQPANPPERLIYELIVAAEKRDESLSLDEIGQKTKLDTATINSTLSILEIKKIIINRNGYFNLSF